MLDWVGSMIGLPEQFLCLSDNNSKGGGVIQVKMIFIFLFNSYLINQIIIY